MLYHLTGSKCKLKLEPYYVYSWKKWRKCKSNFVLSVQVSDDTIRNHKILKLY